ncbi:hypothetical protein [Candidatus Ichthyocystis sparus]|uniref:hypothetical protein n=1 Tax=Candidatus Ichthyocystis sparus TaxID=1561004 RepID=UPI000B8909F5|nr:hypothetical protein [Candidatus Ichthyocystis sparus]
MNPITGVGGADSGSIYDDDQAGSGSSQQVHTLPGDVLGVATTVAAVSTITTTSSVVATSVSTSTVSVTSVGKGSSGDRGKKGKGAAPRRYVSGYKFFAAAVHSASADASSELAGPSYSGSAEYCDFHICTSDWLDLRRMEDSFLCAIEEKATAFFRSRIQESSLLRDDSVIEDFSELRDVSFSGLEADMGGFREKYFAEVHNRVIFSHHLVDGEIKKFSTEEASQFRESFLTAIAAKIKEYLALVWSLEVSGALYRAICASDRAQAVAARVAARAAAFRVAASISDTDPDSTRASALSVVRTADSRANLSTAVCSPVDPVVARARDAVRASTADGYARAAEDYSKAVAARAAAAQAHAAFAARFIAQARAAGSSAPNSGSNSNLVLDRLVAAALSQRAAACVADSRAAFAAAAAALSHARLAAVFTTDTDPDSFCARARARNRAYAADSYARTTAALAADARDTAAAADRAVVQARVADRSSSNPGSDFILNSLVAVALTHHATARVADDDPDPTRVRVRARARCRPTTADSRARDAATCAAAADADRVVAQARSSTSLLTPDSSSLVQPVFVDLFGFAVPTELGELVRELISSVCELAKSFYPYTMRVPVSDVFREHSDSEERRCAWCLTNMKLYELKFVAKCIAAYFVQLLPEFVNRLCNLRAWDSSSRSFLPLMGSKLRDFWASLDKAIFRALRDFFVAKWTILTARFSVPALLSSVPGEVSSALCGGDFVDACAGAATSSSSPSIFVSITGGMGLQVAPNGGDSVNLFGFELPSEVGKMVEVLVREVSVLARSIYSSLVRVQVLDAMSKLSNSEKCAWLITNMMLYKTGFVARCLVVYSDELCPDFICSLFSSRPGDASGRRLLSLMGNSLRDFWLALGNAILETVEGIFVAEWGEFARQFFVPLEPVEESSPAVLCGRDFIGAFNNAGVPALAVSMMGRARLVARRALSHFAEVASGSSVATDVPVAAGVSVNVPTTNTSITDVSTVSVVGVEGSSTTPRIGSSYAFGGAKKLFMSRWCADVSSSSGMSSSVPSGSIVSSGSLSSAPVATSSFSTLATTDGTAYGEGDIGERLAALLNRGLPPSPPPASEPTPTEGKASSSSRGSSGGKRKKKS